MFSYIFVALSCILASSLHYTGSLYTMLLVGYDVYSCIVIECTRYFRVSLKIVWYIMNNCLVNIARFYARTLSSLEWQA